jgi:hypothetical protein
MSLEDALTDMDANAREFSYRYDAAEGEPSVCHFSESFAIYARRLWALRGPDLWTICGKTVGGPSRKLKNVLAQ